MSRHAHLKQPTNICCFHGPLVTSKNSTSYLNLLLRHSSLKNPAFWLALRFLNHKPDFSQTCCFCKRSKDHWHFHDEAKNIYIWVDKIFTKTPKPYFWKFWALGVHERFFKNQYPSLYYFMRSNFMIKNQKKNWWWRDLVLQTDEKIDKAKFIGHFCYDGCPTSFRTR